MLEINAHIADRSNVFYWQTDRAIDPAQAGAIWADRHRYFSDAEIVARVSQVLPGDELASIELLDPNSQTNLGNVNSVRLGHLASGKEVIVRCHPKGVRNGYFHAEAVAAHTAKTAGLPTFDTLAVHDYEGGDDFAFHVVECLPGTAIKHWLDAHPGDEATLVPAIGRMMARLHQVSVTGFGPFDNEAAKQGKLVGLHNTQAEALSAALPFNVDFMQQQGIISPEQGAKITTLFSDGNTLLQDVQPVLVHNDFADWNLLTDGKTVTGILDWDECVGGDPIMDIACWSTFFDPQRLDAFLDGYWQGAIRPADFEQKFELMRLRYVLSKMTLRIRRYSWAPNDDIKAKIETGRVHLQESLHYFGLG
jgi:Ser/Thr protein kinase RdoA (MazF antagonist)